MDGITVYCIRKELSKYLPLKVQKVYQPKSYEIVLSVWKPQFRAKILLSVAPQNPFFGLTSESLNNPKSPSGFCLGLRKRLEGGTLTELDQESADRVVYLIFSGRNDFGDTVSYKLVLDMAGMGGNIGLYNSGSLVAAALPPEGQRFRLGVDYSPPKTDKIDILQDSIPKDFGDSLLRRLCQGTESSLRSLTSAVQGVGVELARAIITSIPLSPQSVFSEDGAMRVTESLLKMRNTVLTERFSPCLYKTERGGITAHCLPLIHLEPAQEYGTVLETMEAYRNLYLEKRRTQAAYTRGRQLYEKALKKVRTKIAAVSQDLMEAHKADQYRLWAELIDATGQKISSGMKEMWVLDYYKDPPVKVSVPLDSRYSSGDNARRYYAKYRKMTKAAKLLRKSLLELEQDMERLQRAGRCFADKTGDSEKADFDSLERALPSLEKAVARVGIKTRSDRKKSVSKDGSAHSSERGQPVSTPPGLRLLEGPSGSKIYVGTTARANDYIVTQVKRQGDFWFHAKAVKGAHVLVRPKTPGELPHEDLMAAAKIAAAQSQANLSGKVKVDWVSSSRVKKPRGGAPGFVTYTGQKSIMVDFHQAAPTSDERS